MKLNNVKPGKGARFVRKRLGRGIGSGFGKTGGRGHKGQHSRSGGYHKIGFEGGQMPLVRRIPKIGITRQYRTRRVVGLPLSSLVRLSGAVIDHNALCKAGLIDPSAKQVKVFCNISLQLPLSLKGIKVTKGARVAIESAGGSIVDENE